MGYRKTGEWLLIGAKNDSKTAYCQRPSPAWVTIHKSWQSRAHCIASEKDWRVSFLGSSVDLSLFSRQLNCLFLLSRAIDICFFQVPGLVWESALQLFIWQLLSAVFTTYILWEGVVQGVWSASAISWSCFELLSSHLKEMFPAEWIISFPLRTFCFTSL